MKKILTLFAFWASMMTVSAQSTGEIRGKVTDEKGEGIPSATVSIVDHSGKNTGQGVLTDLDGNYIIGPLTAGTYDVKFSYVGYDAVIKPGILVRSDNPTRFSQQLKPKAVGGPEVVIIAEKYIKPLIDGASTTFENTNTAADIKDKGSLTVDNIVSSSVGVTQNDANGGISINGGREDEVKYVINGHTVIGSHNVATGNIAEVTVLAGGIPAKYGDATSGIINITLKDAHQSFGGNIEAKTTQGLDKFGTTRAAATLYGPLVKIKDKQGDGPGSKRTLLGFSASFQYQRDNDRSPSSIGVWQVKPNVLNDIRSAPIIPNPNGGFYNKAEFLTFADLYKTSAKPNNDQQGYIGSGEIGLYPMKNLSISIGGNYDYERYHSYVREYSLLNAEHNPLYKEQDYLIYGRLTQWIVPKKSKIEGEQKPNKSGVAVENANYTIQFDYEKTQRGYADEFHGSNLFEYGYIGKFETQGAYGYTPGSTRTYNGKNYSGYVQNLSLTDTAVRFTPGTINPLGATFTTDYFQLLGATKDEHGGYNISGNSKVGYAQTVDEIAQFGGLINGQRSTPIYDLWYNVGRQYNGYGVDRNNESYRGKAEASFEIVKMGGEKNKNNTHKIELGVEYEQRIQRSYAINPLNLWDVGKTLVNTHLTLDTANPIFRVNGQDYTLANINSVVFNATDSIRYNNKANLTPGAQTTFDRNLRTALGWDPNGTQNIDFYSVDPKYLSLKEFSADNLLGYVPSGGSTSILSYYGYDHMGNVLTSQPTLNDYFKAKDANGNYTRLQGAFMPTYASGYIQDKFYYKDLGFVFGLRVDRYDANQYVLKDAYSLYDTKKAGDVKNLFTVPANIGDNYVVYIDRNSKDGTASKVTGYRDGDNWYDQYGRPSTGKLVSLQSPNGLLPYLNLPGSDGKNIADTLTYAGAKSWIKSSSYDPTGSFAKYQAQYLFMPRLQFSFNITDQAQFFAHYDILSQRPQDRNQLNMAEYYYFSEYSAVKDNPNLKPIKKTDYEFGFKQKIASFAAVTISAFYQETRNLIQLRKIQYAFPNDYTTFDNIDFRSAKGLRLIFEMRRIKNFKFDANYTLQFVEGTGSDDQSQSNLVSSNQPNFRTVYPVSTDARHQIKFNLDYRLPRGKEYKGPTIKNYQVLADFGINLGLNLRSGTPTRQSATVTDDASISGSVGRSRTISLSSRLPWYTRLDLRVNKDFVFNIKSGKKKSESKEGREMGLSVYVYIQNLLNTENVLSIYPYTLNANDDGFLASSSSANAILTKTSGTPDRVQAYKDLYRAKVNNPDNYSLPRRVYLGLNVNF